MSDLAKMGYNILDIPWDESNFCGCPTTTVVLSVRRPPPQDKMGLDSDFFFVDFFKGWIPISFAS